MGTSEDVAPKSVLLGNDAFVRKLLLAKPFSERSSRVSSTRYFSDESSAVPFTWEEKPGTPKKSPTLDFVPPLTSPPPVTLRPLHGPKIPSPTTHRRSCFFKSPWRILKTKKVGKAFIKGNDQHDDALESLDHESLFSWEDEDFFSTPYASNASSLSFISNHSPASSKGSVSSSSKLFNFAKGVIHRQLFRLSFFYTSWKRDISCLCIFI